MPYLLAAGDQPGSPTSWVKMDSPDNNGGVMSSAETTTSALMGNGIIPNTGTSGGSKLNHHINGRMTTGRPLPRPLPPITSSGKTFSNYVSINGLTGPNNTRYVEFQNSAYSSARGRH